MRRRIPARDTMDILGHSRIAVTTEVYTGADDASRREADRQAQRAVRNRSGVTVAVLRTGLRAVRAILICRLCGYGPACDGRGLPKAGGRR